jgi:hypothetical protein
VIPLCCWIGVAWCLSACTTTPSALIDQNAIFNDGKLEKLQVLARISTDIKYFHPSEGVAGTDWDSFLALHLREAVHSTQPFDQELREIFAEVAPSVVINGKAASPLNTLLPNQKMAVWQQNGYTEVDGGARPSAYYRKIVFKNLFEIPAREFIYTAKYGDIEVSIPLALPVGENSRILPMSTPFKDHIPEEVFKQGYDDLYLCLASNAKIWGIFYEYYPYFRDVHFDWSAELPVVLSACSKNTISEKITSLRKSLTKLQDNHIGLFPESHYLPQFTVPVAFNLIGGKIIATFKNDEITGIQIGDELIEVDGHPVEQVIAGYRAQSLRQGEQADDEIAMAMLFRREKNQMVHLSLKSGSMNKPYVLDQPATEPATPFYWTARRAYAYGSQPLEKKLSTGILYLNLAKLHKAQVGDALKEIQAAQAVVLDFRSYPADFEAWREFFAHLTDKTVKPLPMYFHIQKLPAQLDTELMLVPQSIQPLAPFVHVPMVALSSRFTVSQGEQALGYLQEIGIPIIGEVTYGANGDIVNADILGGAKADRGLDLTFTGMEIRQRDDSRFAGIGIVPDFKVARTQEGLISNQDEVLEFAKKHLEEQLGDKASEKKSDK